MKSTCCASSGCVSQMFQVSAVLTGCSMASRARSSSCLELRDRQVPAQQHLVADEHAHHVDVVVGEADRGLQLLLVLVAVVIEPGADGDVHVVPLGELGDLRERALHAVGAHRLHLAGEQRQVRVDLRLGGQEPVGRILVGAERARTRSPG